MDVHNDRERDVQAWDLFALAACDPLRAQPGCHVIPSIPDAALAGALGRYLQLRPGERPLAVVDRSRGASPAEGCTLTTRRICWSTRAPRDNAWAGSPATDQADAPPDEAGGRACSLEYSDLPETITLTSKTAPRLDLGEGRELTLRDLPGPAAKALAEALSTLRLGARTGKQTRAIAPEHLDLAREALAQGGRQAESIRRVIDEFRAFHAQAQAATPRGVVGRAVLAACILVYLAMVVSGASGIDPDADVLIAWGGNLGIAVALDGATWRLLTSMFLHGGPIHLAVNMLCLWRAGPLVERLFGNVGFALLYLAAGIGGSLAGAWAHPMVVGVGASGAIFGIFGGLLAFLLTHRAVIPAAVLKPIRGSAIGFVVYNVLFGFFYPRIDNAAHLGGLATGFLAGLLLRRPWPLPRPSAGLARQLGGGALLAAILSLASIGVDVLIRRDPAVAAPRREDRNPAVAFNALMRTLGPFLERIEAIESELNGALGRLEAAPADDPGVPRDLDALIAEAGANQAALKEVTDPDPDLAALASTAAETQADLLRALQALRRALDFPEDHDLIDGPQGFVSNRKRSRRGTERFLELSRIYAAKHGLTFEGDEPNPEGPPRP